MMMGDDIEGDAVVGARKANDQKPTTSTTNDHSQMNQSRSASPHDSPQLSPTAVDHDEDGAKSGAPLQKRRRVTRACDECRRKKIKCDGKQPCSHCTVYSYECTYDQPSNRRRNPPPQYIESLEAQLKRANAILRMILPSADLNDPELEAKLRHLSFSPSPMRSTPTVLNSVHFTEESENGVDDQLESMVKATGQLDLDEQGNLEYHGHSSGLHFVRRMRESLGDVMGPEPKGQPLFISPKSRPMSQVFDSPRSLSESPFDGSLPGSDLPPRDLAREMCDVAINDAGALLRFVHYPTFVKQMENLYDLSPEQYGNEENMFLPLFYSVLSVATLFAKNDGSGLEGGYETAIAEGFKYFKQCRQLMDIADCRDLRQLQAIVFMILFLQSSAKLSVCYAYIGVALRSALRMGLHRCFTESFNPIEAETRKRVFWVIRKMDTYVGALLGLPHSLNDDEIDQEYPTEVDDEYITEHGIIPMPEGKISVMSAGNAHTKLVQILSKIVKYIYPVRASTKGQAGAKNINTYSVSYVKIVEIERDLQIWQDDLPVRLKPGGEATRIMQRCQHLLRMAYAHAQMMLYRPFLHYVSQTRETAKVDKRSYACAAACVSVSRNIVHIAIEMKKRNLLVGAYWFTMYTTFFAILSLVFYALENPDSEASQDVLKVAREAKDTLESLARRSMAADRCATTLRALFLQLPESRIPRKPSLTRKRRPSPSPYRKHLKTEPQPMSLDSPPQPNSKPDFKPQQNPAPQTLDMSDLQYADAHGFFDIRNQTLSPQVQSMPNFPRSTQAESTFDASPQLPDNFPLADLSAMMFPNPDPFAYPNQAAANTELNYESLFKNMTTDSPAFFPTVTMQQPDNTNGISPPNGFMPPSSTFMYNSTADPQSASQDGDVPLLGPMPMYMMQGDSNRPNTNQQSSHPNTNQRPDSTQSSASPQAQVAAAQQQQAQQAIRNKYFPSGAPTNMNLDSLLGNEEWAGLPADRAPMGAFVSPAVTATDGAFRSRNPQVPGSQQALQFGDLTPGMLGWGLEGF